MVFGIRRRLAHAGGTFLASPEPAAQFLADLPEAFACPNGRSTEWQRYWRGNPINAWIGGNRALSGRRRSSSWRTIGSACSAAVSAEHAADAEAMLQELVDYRLAAYEVRQRRSQTRQT
jgi:hypothetical protein